MTTVLLFDVNETLVDLRPLVAAHGWDLAGAAAVGCRTAFLARPGKVLDPLGAPPTLVAEDVEVLAGRLLDPDAAC